MSLIERAASVCIANGLPLALRGRPGVGKTSLIESVAQRLGLACEVVVGSLREPTDFAGLPVITEEGDVRLAAPAWATRAAHATNGSVILLDELTTASPAVQAAMLRVVRERVVGEMILPDHVRVVAAYNDADDCGGYELELPMRSRLIHLDVVPDIDTFSSGITQGWSIDPAPIEVADISAVTIHRQKWSNMVAAFVRSRTSLLERPPQKGSSGGYPTPRTWEMAIAAAAASDAAGESHEVRELLIAGCIGSAASIEFLSFAENLDIPAAKDLLADPSLASDLFEPLRPDRNMVILLEVAQWVIRARTSESWQNAWVIGAHAARSGFGDLVAWAFRSLPSLRPTGSELPEEFSVISEFLDVA